MKRNFTNENFEDFLRQSADGLRMMPSDKVWKGISSRLKKRRRRFGLAIGTLLLALTTFTYYLVESSSKNLHTFTPGHSALKKGSGENSPAPPIHSSIHLKTPPSKSIALSKNFTQNKIYNFTDQRFLLPGLVASVPAEKSIVSNHTSSSQVPSEEFHPTIVDSYFESSAPDPSATTDRPAEASPELPYTIESVLNSYKPRSKKVSFQFYFTPTVSYRKLAENKSFLRSQSPANPIYTPALIFDVNSVVTHKPDIGFELGMAAKYPITSKMKLRGGLQFNVNRYDIKAYNAGGSVATIMFNGRRDNSVDSLRKFTRYSNKTGYKTDWLQNYYFQISAPVGVEFRISGDEKLQFGVATTIQPTYVLGDRAYLISTDYKNYVEVPQLIRRWNVNTAFETFVGYSTGRLNWQVGPQVRYQLLSSFIDKYPVKENLFDFGLKVGVSINK